MKPYFLIAVTASLWFGASPELASAQSNPVLTGKGPQGAFDYAPRSKARRPGLIDPTCGLIGGPATAAANCDSQTGREWEGLASTDYFTFEPNGSAPNPDIAVGPDDILTILNRTIARYPNPNAPAYDNNGGTASVPYSPADTFYLPPASRQFLDVWLGENALGELCPTQPRTNATCQIDNASIRYDQMQGRFVVLFTVVDNGLINCFGCPDSLTATNNTLRRKASWVLLVSRWATGCQLGTIGSGAGSNIGGTCIPNTTPAVNGLTGNTGFFTTPQPPGPSQSSPNNGGINSNWTIFYGIPDGTCDAACTGGNINSISDLRRNVAPPVGAVTIDCRNNPGEDEGQSVCYLPTSARLGIDNDNLYLVSSVINDNVPLSARTYTLTGNDRIANAWEGTRLRVLKKAAFYTNQQSVATCGAATNLLCPGASSATPSPLQGDFYDLWGDSPRPYAFDQIVDQPMDSGLRRRLSGLNYEPEHVRGRSLASYNGRANQANAFFSIWGAIDSYYTGGQPPQTLLYNRSINFSRTVSGSLPANTAAIPSVVNSPLIIGGIPSLAGLSSTTVPGFTNPNTVIQRDKLPQIVANATPTPSIYVGDNRPHRVISREGHHYVARVGSFAGNRFDGTNNYSSVAYDIIQKLGTNSSATEVYYTSWGNGRFYAPMFDTPANVVQYGAISPINVQPFLEKLFVGTTFPPLAPSDPRTFSYGLISGQSLLACKGQEPSVTTSVGAYPGLFDIRCGEDAYDTPQAYRHPVSGSFTNSHFGVDFNVANQLVPFPIRGGAATDPNNMGLWLYGAYAKGRLASVPGFGQYGTYVAHYPLTFPIRDPYNNTIVTYSDVSPVTSTGAPNPYFTAIQIAKQTEIQPGSRAATTFLPDSLVTRAEMARWVIRSQMDELAVTGYLNSTGGLFCSLADVACPGSTGGTVTDTTGVSGDWRYIETMYRRGYTKGCNATTDAQRRFCPSTTLTRGEMSAFIIRAKMNSVFPTVTSGAATTTTCQQPGTQVTGVGDMFGLYQGCSPYFADVPNTHTFFSFIQKMRELRISNGTSFSTPTQLGTYGPEQPITRAQLVTFLVRAFFP